MKYTTIEKRSEISESAGVASRDFTRILLNSSHLIRNLVNVLNNLCVNVFIFFLLTKVHSIKEGQEHHLLSASGLAGQ